MNIHIYDLIICHEFENIIIKGTIELSYRSFADYEEENFNESIRTRIREITKLIEITELNVIAVPRKLVYI